MKIVKPFINFSLNSKQSSILFLEIILGIIIALGSLYLFLKVGHEVLENEVLFIDSQITNFIYSFRSPPVTSFMTVMTFLGSGLMLLALSMLIIIFINKFRRKDALIYLAILYSAIILNLILKLIYQRPRPNYLPFFHENTLSFPSGHAMNSFVFFAALSYFIFRETGNIKIGFLAGVFSLIIVGLIGISRIYLGVHYPSDVIGGYLAGFMWFTTAIVFEKIIIDRRLYKASKK